MIEPASFPEPEFSRRRLLAFCALAIPAGAPLADAVEQTHPNSPPAETRSAAALSSASVTASVVSPEAPAYFC